jgi:hypothetical protein
MTCDDAVAVTCLLQVLMTDGCQLSLISCAVRVAGRYVLGSWGDRGILLCQPHLGGTRDGDGGVEEGGPNPPTSGGIDEGSEEGDPIHGKEEALPASAPVEGGEPWPQEGKEEAGHGGEGRSPGAAVAPPEGVRTDAGPERGGTVEAREVPAESPPAPPTPVDRTAPDAGVGDEEGEAVTGGSDPVSAGDWEGDWEGGADDLEGEEGDGWDDSSEGGEEDEDDLSEPIPVDLRYDDDDLGDVPQPHAATDEL